MEAYPAKSGIRQVYNGYKSRKQNGAALIVVLLVLAVMISVAATMTDRLFVNFNRAENRLSHQQAYWYSIGVEALAKYGIEQSYEEGDTINLSQPWALREQVFPLDYGQASGRIRDMQSCFNINVLGNQVRGSGNNSAKPFLVSVWQRILEESGTENYQAEVIADSTWEFLDSNDTVVSDYGVEDSAYEGLNPAYLAPNGMIADRSELRAVYQVDNKVMRSVEPVICALPWEDWRLNVNTVDVEGHIILMALFSPQLSASDAMSLVENRPFDGWATVDDFLAEQEIARLDATTKDKAKGYLSTDSQYFELDAQVVVNESRVRIRSLLYSGDKNSVSVIRRRFGGVIERVPDRSPE